MMSNVLDEYVAASGLQQSAPMNGIDSGGRPAQQSTSGSVGVEVPAGPPRLAGARDPYYTIQHERGEHRIMVFLKAKGLSNLEIARELGFTPVAVSNILRQPVAQQLLVEIIHRNGDDEVQTLLQGAAADMVQRLIYEADHAESSRDRIAASDKVLDRIYGKPNQALTTYDGGKVSRLSDDELEREYRKLHSQRASPAEEN